MAMDTVFWICVSLVAYTYALYPAGVALAARLSRAAPAVAWHEWPTVSVVLCARNEGSRIGDRLRNLARQEYERGRLEIIVVSDGSTDDTVARVEQVRAEIEDGGRGPRLVLVEKAAAEGKAAALNDAVAGSSAEVLVMADARQLFGRDDEETDTVRRLVAALGDPGVGCVSGELVFIDENTGTLQADLGLYWRYEKWIRRSESRVDSVPGVTGAIYAMRRGLFEPLPPGTLLDDVVIPLRAILRGYRVVFDGGACARDRASADPGQEWRRKVRTLAGNWQLLTLVPAAFVPFRNRIWLQFVSHKLLRLVVPFTLLLALAASAAVPTPLFRALLAIQASAWAGALLAAFLPALRRFRVLGVMHTFALLNLAAIAGFWVWMTGRTRHAWGRPSERPV